MITRTTHSQGRNSSIDSSPQKKYGEGAVDDAAVVMNELLAGQDREMARIQQLAGLR